jgi:hypothetical protein
MSNNKPTLGNISLWTSLAGPIVLGLCYLLLQVVASNTALGPDGGGAYAIVIVGGAISIIGGSLFVILELAAFGCGLSARHTTTGKAGLQISSVLLVLALVCIILSIGIALLPLALIG